MEEIKVGLYGRTNLGNIIKFAYFCDENNEIYTNKVILIDEVTKSPRPYYYFKEDERIVKESKNIIDLIEVGDYVNGKRVLEKIGSMFLEVSSSALGDNRILGYMIKSICTREQFAAVEYKLDN